jgi:hypothetical protein
MPAGQLARLLLLLSIQLSSGMALIVTKGGYASFAPSSPAPLHGSYRDPRAAEWAWSDTHADEFNFSTEEWSQHGTREPEFIVQAASPRFDDADAMRDQLMLNADDVEQPLLDLHRFSTAAVDADQIYSMRS